MSSEFFRGTDGRVQIASTPVAGIDSWEREGEVDLIPVPHFESDADGNDVVWETDLVGLGRGTINVEGIFDGGSTVTDSLLREGTAVTLDLLFSKSTGRGFYGLPAICKSVGASQKLREKGSFRASFKLQGPPPVSSTS